MTHNLEVTLCARGDTFIKYYVKINILKIFSRLYNSFKNNGNQVYIKGSIFHESFTPYAYVPRKFLNRRETSIFFFKVLVIVSISWRK